MIALSKTEKDALIKLLDDVWGYPADAGDNDLANRVSDFQMRLRHGTKLREIDTA